MNAGNSPSTWMKNRGTLISAGYSPFTRMRNWDAVTISCGAWLIEDGVKKQFG